MSMLRGFPLAFATVLLACAPEPAADDEAGETADETADATDETETGEPIDTDQDGLSDDEEAQLGTDPLVKDTDKDNYWDAWEVLEGSDPLDPNSRIYTGYWPYNPDKDALEQGSWASVGTAVGTPFPRDAFVDQHGDLVDVYDFANFTSNPTKEPAFFIIDVSAQWCGPCHTVAAWLSGIDSENTLPLQNAFPNVREQVHALRVWWLTFIVEDSSGAPPTMEDSASWYGVHEDNKIPVFADTNQDLLEHFLLGFFPHFFLLDPQLKILYFPTTEQAQQDSYSGLGQAEAML